MNPYGDPTREALESAYEAAARRVGRATASYRAARRDRWTDSRARSGANGAGGYALRSGTFDSHLREPDRDELVVRSRDAYRNYPIARSLVEQHVTLVCGDGFSPTPSTDDTDIDKRIAELWAEWSEDCDVRGELDCDAMVEVVCRQAAVDGDLAAVPLKSERVQLIDGQLLRNPGGKSDTLEWRGGVKVDGFGRPVMMNVAQWSSDGRTVQTTKDGTPLELTGGYESPMLLSRVRWSSQTRGEPALAPVLEDLGQLQDYIESVEQAAHMHALVAYAHFSSEPGGTRTSTGAEEGVDALGRGYDVARMSGPAILPFAQGDRFEAVQSSQPSDKHKELVRERVRLIGAALGLPLEIGLLAFDESNYHGALAALEIAKRGIERTQDWIVRAFLQRLYRWRVDDWAEAGLLGEKAFEMEPRQLYKVDWRYPKPLAVDPKRDADVYAIMSGRGAMSIRDLRPDWMPLQDQIARERERAASKGIAIEATPGSMAGDAGGAGGSVKDPSGTTGEQGGEAEGSLKIAGK